MTLRRRPTIGLLLGPKKAFTVSPFGEHRCRERRCLVDRFLVGQRCCWRLCCHRTQGDKIPLVGGRARIAMCMRHIILDECRITRIERLFRTSLLLYCLGTTHLINETRNMLMRYGRTWRLRSRENIGKEIALRQSIHLTRCQSLVCAVLCLCLSARRRRGCHSLRLFAALCSC